MDDVLKEFLSDGAPVLKEVKFSGKTISLHFRRISGGEKANLLKGQKVQAGAGKSSTFEVDLGENAHNKAQLVFYSLCNEDGTRAFKKLEDAKAIDAGKLEALYQAASEVNSDDLGADDSGKS